VGKEKKKDEKGFVRPVNAFGERVEWDMRYVV
jgi:hypothetical protein